MKRRLLTRDMTFEVIAQAPLWVREYRSLDSFSQLHNGVGAEMNQAAGRTQYL
jgi:hypothetical protein